MQIRPIEVYNPNMPYDYDPDLVGCKAFGLKRSTKTVFYPPTYKKIVDTVELQNGKTVKLNKTYDKFGNLIEKFSCIRDEMGEWMRLKVKSLKDGKVVNVFKGERCQ